jgi:exopolyphosphatase/guanosine-5'-triphosphate,3'-diphosphate pyrophosphatase
MRAGVIEIGTNSIKFCIAEKQEERFQILVDKNIVTRLGERQWETGRIADSSMDRTITAIKDCLDIAHSLKVDRIIGVGTMVLREATNSEEFLQKVYLECGIAVEVVSHEREARLSYQAAVSAIQAENANNMVVDIGGGSTEFIWGSDQNIESIVSLNLGVVQLTERFLVSDPVKNSEMRNAIKNIQNSLLENRITQRKPDQIIGIGGTITTMIAIKYGMQEYIPERIHGAKLDIKDVKAQIGIFKLKTVEERKKIAGLQPERADVILAGALIVYTILRSLKVNSLTGSNRGLRCAILLNVLKENFF